MKKLALTLIFTMLIAINAPAGTLTDTGITKCYDEAGTEITCPQPGQDYYGQDANYNSADNQMSYTSLGGGTMVQDNVTGLIWEVKTDDGSIHDKDNKYTWQDAQDVFIAGLNAEKFGNYYDWRLPAREELRSIVDYSIRQWADIQSYRHPFGGILSLPGYQRSLQSAAA